MDIVIPHFGDVATEAQRDYRTKVTQLISLGWDFFGRNDAKAETPVLWPPHAKSWLIRKDSDAGRDWGQEEKGTTEDEMAGWHHWLDGRESEWTLGVGDGQGGLACCDSWGHKELDTTERLNWTEPNRYFQRKTAEQSREEAELAQIDGKRPYISHSQSQETSLTTHAQKISLEVGREVMLNDGNYP